MGGIQAKVAASGGDIRVESGVALWPYPPVIWGKDGRLFIEDDYRFFCSVLQPGDFILTRSNDAWLSNWAIGRHGTAFIHLAVYTERVLGRKDLATGCIQKPRRLTGLPHTGRPSPNEHERTVTHAVSEGVVCQDLMRLTSHADEACVIRPHENALQRWKIMDAALARVGQPYNFDFTPKGPPASYCTELGYYCCQQAGIQVPIRHLIPVSLWGVVGLGATALVSLADSFVEKFGMLACSISCNHREFWWRSYMGDGMRKAISEADDACSYHSL